MCVIVNATAENIEVIGDAGLSYAVNDIGQLRDQLRAVLADANLRRQYGARATARVAAHYNWEAVTNQYEDLLRALVQQNVTSGQ